MSSLREWLVRHGWFILSCDPGPASWYICALAPSGRVQEFKGTATGVQVLALK